MRHLPALALACALLLPAANTSAAETDPEAVVRAFNHAVSQRDMAGAEKLMARGAVQFTLRAAHPGVPDSATGITSDLKLHWNTISPVLFSVTSSYKRTPENLVSHVDGDLATVWADISTATVERSGKSREDRFSELYLLVRTDGQWRIGAMADNRGTDKLKVAPAAAASP